LDDPARQWKISESDYSEREYWKGYIEAFEDVLTKTSTHRAPWFIIPSNHKWFRDLSISQIITRTMEEMDMQFPKPIVNLTEIRRKYHQAIEEEESGHSKKK
jgi:polyphosphate kinase 2 (PPK2 family)